MSPEKNGVKMVGKKILSTIVWKIVDSTKNCVDFAKKLLSNVHYMRECEDKPC